MSYSPSIAQLSDVRVTFSQWGQSVNALDGVSLDISEGEWLLLVGPNGSGKTTILNVLSGRVAPVSGAATIRGRDIQSLNNGLLAGAVFQVHQDPLLGTAPWLTVFENLWLADKLAGNIKTTRIQTAERYRELLQPLGLEHRLNQTAELLSGGERQLLTLAIASIRPSMLILLDEPTAALDPQRESISIELIRSIQKQGKSIVHVSHTQEHVQRLGDRVVIMRSGRKVYDSQRTVGSEAELFDVWNHQSALS